MTTLHTFIPRENDFGVGNIAYTIYPARWGSLEGWEIKLDGEDLPEGQLWRTEEAASQGASDRIQFMVDYWCEQLTSDRKYAVVIDGVHYRISPENANQKFAHARGHGGHPFYIKKGDQVFYTTNLWAQGRVPLFIRHKLPDDAEFITAEAVDASSLTTNEDDRIVGELS